MGFPIAGKARGCLPVFVSRRPARAVQGWICTWLFSVRDAAEKFPLDWTRLLDYSTRTGGGGRNVDDIFQARKVCVVCESIHGRG